MPSYFERPGSRLVIGITGRMGAGKTSTARHLSSKHGFQYLRYSQVLSEWQAKAPESKARLQEVGWEVMARGLQAELNLRLIEQIMPDVDVAVDGLRHPLDYESLRNSFLSSFNLLYIDSPPKERFERLNRLGRYADFGSFDRQTLIPSSSKSNRSERLLRPYFLTIVPCKTFMQLSTKYF